MSDDLDWIVADLPAGVRALTTTRRLPGASTGPWAQFNLALHVGDRDDAVHRNRASLRRLAGLPSEPRWLEQVHGADVVELDAGDPPRTHIADAATTRAPGVVLAIMTADCVPIVLATDDGRAVAAIHAGWRGLARGVVERTVASLGALPSQTAAWIGPAIGPTAYEVGAEVRNAMLDVDGGADAAFVATRPGHWLCDLPGLVRRRLAACGIARVSGGTLCTASDASRFFSHRRDGVTGRIATLAWIVP